MYVRAHGRSAQSSQAVRVWYAGTILSVVAGGWEQSRVLVQGQYLRGYRKLPLGRVCERREALDIC